MRVGAILSHLAARAVSPEARPAAAAFRADAHDLRAVLEGSTSGRELMGKGFSDDVGLASDLDRIVSVPAATGGAHAAPAWPS